MTESMLLTLLIVFSFAFAFSHFVLSAEPFRSRSVGKMKTLGFRGVYSFIAIGTFAPAAVIEFSNRHMGPELFTIPRWAELTAAFILMFFALQFLVLGLANPSPLSLIGSKPEPRGILRITRHPMNMGWVCFGLAHILANGYLGDVVFFGLCFVVVGLFGPYHIDRRKRRGATADRFATFFATTSVIPFGAILAGRQRFELSEFPWPMVVVATAAWGALVYFHGRLFGAPLISF